MPRPLLITAGATRNPVDAMRVLTAGSSGATGVALAEALAADHAVHLLGSPEALLRARGLSLTSEGYTSTRDLMERVRRFALACPRGVILHAAAVGDYETEPHPGKIPSGQDELVIRLRRAPKILDAIRPWGFQGLLVSFKAAPPLTPTRDLLQICKAQRLRTGSDWVFGNVIGALDQGLALVGADEEAVFEDRDAALAALVDRVRRDGLRRPWG